MADPADRVIAATANANSVLFICPSRFEADVYSPVFLNWSDPGSIRFVSRLTRLTIAIDFSRCGKDQDRKTAPARALGSQHMHDFESFLECGPRVQRSVSAQDNSS